MPGGIQSWHDLLKPEFKERIVILNNANQEIYVALNALGADLTKLITREQLQEAKEWYKGVKAQARAIVPSYGEMADVMARKEAWLSGGAWAAIIGWVAEKGVTLDRSSPQRVQPVGVTITASPKTPILMWLMPGSIR